MSLCLRTVRLSYPQGSQSRGFRKSAISPSSPSIGMRSKHCFQQFQLPSSRPCLSAPDTIRHPYKTISPNFPPPRCNYHSSPTSQLKYELADPNLSQLNVSDQKGERGFTYGLAASYCGKQHRFNPAMHYYSENASTTERWLAGQLISPGAMKGKRTPSGQDACFISPLGTTGAAAFGVADGVGGWIEQRIDSADFAHGICEYMDDACRKYPSASFSNPSPLDLLQAGYARVCKDKAIAGGGSTACLGVVDRKGTLRAANLGDSGFMHIRLNKVHYVSDHQTHAFNTPFQLSKMPPRILMQIKDYGGESPISDYPKNANMTQHTLQHGDVLLFGTDGVWDNLSSQDLLEIISDKMTSMGAWNNDADSGITVSKLLPALTEEPHTSQAKSLQAAIACGVVEKAKAASMNMRRDSPFAKAVQRQFPSERYSGGKVDDICVVIAITIDGNGALEI